MKNDKVIDMKPELAPGLARTMALSYLMRNWHLCLMSYGSKEPHQTKWNTPGVSTAVSNAIQMGDDVENMGVLLSASGVCSIDIDHLELAREWLAARGVDLDDLLNAPDAVGISSGRPGSAKLIYSLDTPLPSKKVILQHEGVNTVVLEFRSASVGGSPLQDVLPPSRHPLGSWYHWTGKGVTESVPDASGGISEELLRVPGAIPPLPDSLKVIWGNLIEQSSHANTRVPDSWPTSFKEVRSALSVIPADVSRPIWVECGMALHLAFDGSEEAFDLWDAWSAQSATKYKPSEMEGQWRSFKVRTDGITIASLFHHAKTYGWERPKPDVSNFFKPVVTPDGERSALKSLDEVVAELFPASPPFPFHLLPGVLGDYAVEVARSKGTDPLVPAFAGLAAISGAADSRSTLTLWDDYTVPPVMRFMTIGDPGDKKTPGSTPMFVPLKEIEDCPIARQQYLADKMAWVGKEARYASEMKSYREWCESPEASMPNAVPPTMMGDLPPEPVPRLLILQDATSQGIVKQAQYRPHGFLLYQDEFKGLVGKLVKPGSGEDGSVYTASYMPAPWNKTRAGDGVQNVPWLSMAMYGNIQIAVLKKHVEFLSDDGLFQRFIIGIIDQNVSGISDPTPAWASLKHEYSRMIHRVFDAGVMHYARDDEGYRLMKAWEIELDGLKRRYRQSGYSPTIVGAVSKLHETAGRLAMLFHMATAPDAPVVPADIFAKAIEFCRTFVVQSIFSFDRQIGTDPIEKWMIGNVLRQSQPGVVVTVTISSLKKNAKSFRAKFGEHDNVFGERLTMAMGMLESIGPIPWVVRLDPKSWVINPNLAIVFANLRAQMLADNSARRERILSS